MYCLNPSAVGLTDFAVGLKVLVAEPIGSVAATIAASVTVEELVAVAVAAQSPAGARGRAGAAADTVQRIMILIV